MSISPARLKMKTENARWSWPPFSWAASLGEKPTRLSCSSTRMRSSSDSAIEGAAVTLEYRRQPVARLHCVEQLAVEDDTLLLLARFGFLAATLPVEDVRVTRGGFELVVELREQLETRGRAPRGRRDRVDQSALLTRFDDVVPQTVAFLEHAGHAHPRSPRRPGEVQRGRRDRETWWVDAEMSRDEAVGDLVVPRPADAVNELVGG